MSNIIDVIGYFKDEFELLMKKFKDTRQINYKKDYRIKESLVQCNWSKNNIKIIFCIIPINYYLKNPAHNKIFNNNPESYRNYFLQVARHEYAHSISLESYNKIELCRVPFIEIKKYWLNNQFFKVLLKYIFFDFIANYLIFEKIDDSIPEEYIKINIQAFQTAFLARYKMYEFIKVCLLHSQIFYIFKMWNDLKYIFKDYKLNVFLEYLYIINKIFEKIFRKNRDLNLQLDFDSAIVDINKLAFIMDKIVYQKMVIQNYYDKSQFKMLIKFKQQLNK